MPEYTVIWSRSAENDLAHFWLMTDMPSEVERAAREGDRLLARNPESPQSVPHEGLRTVDVVPLRFCYEVDREQRVVNVVGLAYLFLKT